MQGYGILLVWMMYGKCMKINKTASSMPYGRIKLMILSYLKKMSKKKSKHRWNSGFQTFCNGNMERKGMINVFKSLFKFYC